MSTHKKILNVAILAATLSGVGTGQVLAAKMYWTARIEAGDSYVGAIQRANLDGSNVEDLVIGLSIPLGIALDLDAGKMYWTDFSDVDVIIIRRANLDGTDVETLVSIGPSYSSGIALDLAAGKMYWTDGTGKIQRGNLDGSNVEDLVTGLDWPFGIALDPAAGKMYWADTGRGSWMGGKIQRANLDGSDVEDLVTVGDPEYKEYPEGIALDLAAGKMYWSAGVPGCDKSDGSCWIRIHRANLNGSNVEDLLTTGNDPTWSDSSAIALDLAAGKMYWTDTKDGGLGGPGKIQRANLDGSNIEDLVTELGWPFGIALDLTLPVAVDIKPGSCPNPLNRKSHGNLPVAIVSTETFDVSTIDVSTITLRRESVESGVGPASVSIEDVASPFGGQECECHDLNGDGLPDLLLKFRTNDVVDALELGPLPGGAYVPLTVKGNLLASEGGGAFRGSDCIRLVPPGDIDMDGDVDGTDFITFSLCFNGSLKPPAAGCTTTNADLDADGDVDGIDFITFSTCFNGSLNPPNCP